MALVRQAIPSPNYRSGRPSSRLIVVHTSEGAQTFQSLGNFLANPANEVSYQVGFDNSAKGVIGAYVKYHDTAWAALDANSWGEHGCCCTPSGASYGWSRDTWLSKAVLLENCAAWIAEECARYGIPVLRADAGAIMAGAAGVCGHADVTAAGAGGDHGDPGPNFPWDHVLTLAEGVPSAPSVPSPPTGVAPPFPGRLLSQPPVMWGEDVRTWQTQMAARGWYLDIDGGYGPQSEGVCLQFQAEKGLQVDGVVGPITWDAAWTAPVT